MFQNKKRKRKTEIGKEKMRNKYGTIMCTHTHTHTQRERERERERRGRKKEHLYFLYGLDVLTTKTIYLPLI